MPKHTFAILAPNTRRARRRIKRKLPPVPAAIADDSIMTLDESAASAGISRDTLDRIRANGGGPIVTEMSDRRKGVRVKHQRAWLDQLAQAK